MKLPDQYSIEVKNARRILTHHSPVYAPPMVGVPSPKVSESRSVVSFAAKDWGRAKPLVEEIAELDERVQSEGIEEGERRLCLMRMARLMGAVL